MSQKISEEDENSDSDSLSGLEESVKKKGKKESQQEYN